LAIKTTDFKPQTTLFYVSGFVIKTTLVCPERGLISRTSLYIEPTEENTKLYI